MVKFLMFLFVPITVTIMYYKLAVRLWLIEGIGRKIILAIAVYACNWVVIALLFEVLLTISFYLGLSETGTWIFSGFAYLIILWMLISFFAEKISNIDKSSTIKKL